MLNKELGKLIRDTTEALRLKGVTIEKDYYVTQVIHALADIENEYFRLVFSGGTCLAKAHKIVKRMSEDVDYKIQIKETGSGFSKNRFLKKLKEFRLLVLSKLAIPDLNLGLPVVRNEGQYMRLEINYPSDFLHDVILRPHILLEFTVSPIRCSLEHLFVKTLIEETLDNVILFPKQMAQCISIEETAVEKWVGLTRRVIAIERGYHHDDETLIRHVYDLNAIKNMNKISENFFEMVQAVMERDAEQFKNQHPEFSENPISEIQKSLNLLKNKKIWKERYQNFIETMVYDNSTALEYEAAIDILDSLSERILNSVASVELS